MYFTKTFAMFPNWTLFRDLKWEQTENICEGKALWLYFIDQSILFKYSLICNIFFLTGKFCESEKGCRTIKSLNNKDWEKCWKEKYGFSLSPQKEIKHMWICEIFHLYSYISKWIDLTVLRNSNKYWLLFLLCMIYLIINFCIL